MCLLFLALTLGVVQLVLYSSVVDRTKLLSGDVLRLGAALERENQPANSVYGPKRDVTERRDDDVTERPDDDVTGTRHDDVTLDSMNDRVTQKNMDGHSMVTRGPFSLQIRMECSRHTRSHPGSPLWFVHVSRDADLQ